MNLRTQYYSKLSFYLTSLSVFSLSFSIKLPFMLVAFLCDFHDHRIDVKECLDSFSICQLSLNRVIGYLCWNALELFSLKSQFCSKSCLLKNKCYALDWKLFLHEPLRIRLKILIKEIKFSMQHKDLAINIIRFVDVDWACVWARILYMYGYTMCGSSWPWKMLPVDKSMAYNNNSISQF